ncbi:MAG TPA: MBL fold metallo-hydrolase, partial [Pyrinomonadaceae bacterium]|nr:MBL fold metallo-hydrolase [Pyrinomonadaceae bacterium]
MATETRYLANDIVKIPVFAPDASGKPTGDKLKTIVLFWGDEVKVTGKQGDQNVVEFQQREWRNGKYETVKYAGLLPKKTTFSDNSVLKVRFVDIGQGDGAIVETPKGQILFIDGGEEEHMRRYINVAYSQVLRTKALDCAAIIVTHGDADHFAGLTQLVKATRNSKGDPMLTADRVFHNGLVKMANASGSTAFGRNVRLDGKTYAIQLEDDLTQVDDSRMNTPFKEWKEALKGLRNKAGKKPKIERIEFGDSDKFDFLAAEDIGVQVLGPITEIVKSRPALRFLKKPGSSSLSASHTVNGHSIVLRLTYGNVRLLFGADLNEESEESLLERARKDNISLAAEVLKVPHHGSSDFSPRILEAIRPVVSVVSSGDENSAKEYIHPRSGLVGALGRYSRATVNKPLIFVTEMVAFFRRFPGRNKITSLTKTGKDGKELYEGFNAYMKSSFGIVHVRTDGKRVLVATHSGKEDQKESYVFHVDERGDIKFEDEPN